MPKKKDVSLEKKIPSFRYALFTLMVLASFLILGIVKYSAPLSIMMFLAWLIINLLAYPLGYRYSDLETRAIDTIKNSLQAVIIMLSVGALISSWIASGTVPSIIYYGLKIVSPKYYLVTALLLSALVSTFTGTSWGTLGTLGVALLGVGRGLGIPAGMIAGALISGSWFGDKLSPLSDTTNFASSVMGVDLITHIKHMLYTSIPSLVTSAVIFLFLGFKVSANQSSLHLIDEISAGLSGNFKIGLITLIPMAIVIILLLKQRPPAQSILIGAASGMVLAIFYQGFSPELVLQSAVSGFSHDFGNDFLSDLLNRGGMNTMNSTVQALIFTTGIGGMLREMGIVSVLVERFAGKLNSTFQLIASGIFVSYLSIALTGSHMFATIMVQSTMLDLYKKNGLKPENASRICEDCGTIGVTIIPWGVTAIFIVDTLGIPFSQFAPYAFFCYLSPIFNLLSGLTGFGIARYSEEEMLEINV